MIWVLSCSPKHGWGLHRGLEVVRDNNNKMVHWPTMEKAREWCIENLHQDPLDIIPKEARARYEARIKLETDFTDLPLFEERDKDECW